MEASEVYRWLMSGGPRGSCDAFDAHVVAGVMALAVVESAGDPVAWVEGCGLDADTAGSLMNELFPHTASVFARLAATKAVPTVPEGEAMLRSLLRQNGTTGSGLEEPLAAMVARRAQKPNHLWQDLGLRNRRELGWLMARHFEPLASKNRTDMKWKKFLYRAICRDGGFLLCTSPTCDECSDLEECFGEEKGESLLAPASPETGATP
jgi:nitrogen fixation protein NifQ